VDDKLFVIKAGECVSAEGALVFGMKDGRKIRIVPDAAVKDQILLYVNSRNADDSEVGQKFVRLSTCSLTLVTTPG
jgi:hypothetical protein